jgi:hypothetical protein
MLLRGSIDNAEKAGTYRLITLENARRMSAEIRGIYMAQNYRVSTPVLLQGSAAGLTMKKKDRNL